MVLRIDRTLLEQLRCHGEEAYPYESCGVLVGDFDDAGNKRAIVVVKCDNTRTDSPEDRYGIGFAELIRIQYQARRDGQDIVGFYHSHPDHPARWSNIDLAEAHWTGCSYVITSIENGKAVCTNSFLLLGDEENKHFVDEAILVLQ